MTRVGTDGRSVRGVIVGGLIALLAGAGACGDDGDDGGTAGTTGSSGRGGGGGTGGDSGGAAGAGGRGGAGGSAGTGGSGGAGGGAGGAAGAGGGAALDETEPNGTTATANDFAAIAINGRVSAAIGAAGDNDFFSVTVPAGTTALYVTTFSTGVDLNCASANTNVVLLASDGTTQLATNNNISGSQLCSHVSYVPAAAGTYFVRVTANSSSSTFAYVLAVRAETLPATAAEAEPNDDGMPAIGNGMNTAEGNDFSTAGAGGPYSADAVVTGALTPAGDEDVFAIQNAGAAAAEVYLETFNGGFGACAAGLDTQIRIRDAAGAVLAFGDDAGTGRFCSFLSYMIPAGTTVYAHVIDFGDNTTAAAYSLHISFP